MSHENSEQTPASIADQNDQAATTPVKRIAPKKLAWAAAIVLTVALAAVVTVAAVGLTNVIPDLAGAVSASSSSTPAPTQSSQIEPLAGDMDNDGELSEFEKQVLAQTAPRDFPMPDGSTVTVDPAQPLPEVVVAAIQAEVAPEALTFLYDLAKVDGSSLAAVTAEANRMADATGRNVVFVLEVNLGRGAGTAWGSTASNKQHGITGIDGGEKSATIATVQKWASTRDYEVIVLD